MMTRSLVAASSFALSIALWPSAEAHACGGCFVPTGVNTQVSSHRMVLSVSGTQTTLWDQIVYVGEPESFAWVLPTRGVVDVGLSADALFQALESVTVVRVLSPPACGLGGGDLAAAESSGSGSSGPPSTGSDEESVEVTAHEVVGPYETVQLSSEDPEALRDWLEQHGYAVPDDVAPLIDDYVLEGFDFLALRLVPGAGIDAMRPVRITTPGAMPALPLRMVAAGTGARTPISLWVVGEGRYQAANMANFFIREDDLVWDWDAGGSNYAELRRQGFEATAWAGWLTEVALPISPQNLRAQVEGFAASTPESGYEGVGRERHAALDADVRALLGHLDPGSVFVTRFGAELARAALSTDLSLEASTDQSAIDGTLEAKKTVGTEPSCTWDDDGGDGDGPPILGSCGVGGTAAGREAALALLAVLAAGCLARRRRDPKGP